MDVRELQARLAASGRYQGAIDGLYGKQTQDGVLLAMTDGPDTRLKPGDIAACAARLGAEPAAVAAFATVESAGDGFSEGRPVILFEGHRFSRATGGQFDKRFPSVSWPGWDRTRYPKDQATRWLQVVVAVGLDVDAGFASASYGRFQVLGENFKACGFNTAYDFAEAMARDEGAQLLAFEHFVAARHLVDALRAKDWPTLADGYNGMASALNHYADKLASAYQKALAHVP